MKKKMESKADSIDTIIIVLLVSLFLLGDVKCSVLFILLTSGLELQDSFFFSS